MYNSKRSGRRAAFVAGLTLLATVLVPGAAGAAAPVPSLAVTMQQQPTHLAPGALGYVNVRVSNLGRVPSSGAINASIELPPGLMPIFGGDGGGTWDCPTLAPAVECTSNPAVPVPAQEHSTLLLFVIADPGAGGVGQATVSLSGGGDPRDNVIEARTVISPDPAPFEIVDFSGWAVDADGIPARQAGAHADVTTNIDFSNTQLPFSIGPTENQKDIEVNVPPGLVANVNGIAKCSYAQVADRDGPFCPVESQIGTVALTTNAGGGFPAFVPTTPLFNVEPPRGVPARFAFTLNGVVTKLDAKIRSGSDYGVTIEVSNISQTLATMGSQVTLWRVPSDPVHDPIRLNPKTQPPTFPATSSAPRRAFVTTPTSCTGQPLVTSVRAASWQQPSVFHGAEFSTDFNGDPVVNEGCERLSFEPDVSIRPTTTEPDAPTGLEVTIDSPQNLDNPDGLATAHLRDVKVTLPEGMTINPGSANGLGACSDAQLGLGGDGPAACPDDSRIGSVEVRTPLLEERLSGGVYLRSQASDDPQSGEMFRLALVVESEERGVFVKLPGRVRVSETGRIVTEVADNPQLPVDRVELRLKGGDRAPLVNPPTCGEKSIAMELSSWAGHSVNRSSGFTVPCTPGLGSFDPSFEAGTVTPFAGATSPFVLRIAKPDRQADIDGVSLELPEGLLANLKGNLGQRIGTARVAAGPGSSPFWLDGPVVLEGPYGDAPFSLRVTVPAVAGPFDLGEVVVRQKVYVDPDDAHVTVVSDPLPTVVKGVPVRLQKLAVDVDRPGFMVNPTSCAPKTVAGKVGAVGGRTVEVSARFQVGGCSELAFRPKLALRFAGRRTRTGAHPALTTVLTQRKGESNIGRAKVTLPSSVALDAVNSTDPKLLCGYDESLKADCPASSIVGRATAVTPVLDRPLSGPVHLVQGIRFGASGNRIRTTPSLLVKLRGQVAIDLRARTSTAKGTNRLVTTFPAVPDAPVSRFALRIDGGKKGILTVTRTARSRIDLCTADRVAAVALDGQSGRRAAFKARAKVRCARARR